jgi:hypothetical protein
MIPVPTLARTLSAAAVLLALQAAPALAQEPAPAARWSLALGAGTDFPLAVGVRLDAEGPYRLRLSTSLGLVPGPYVDAINASVVALGGYDNATAGLLKQTLSSSLIWRTHVGWRAWHGFYLEAGYGVWIKMNRAGLLALGD